MVVVVVVLGLETSATPSRATPMSFFQISSVDVTPSISSLVPAMEAQMRTWTLKTLLPASGWAVGWAGSLAPSALAWEGWDLTVAL